MSNNDIDDVKRDYADKIKNREELKEELLAIKKAGAKIAFTNGCFDILHAGHVRYLYDAKSFADILVVAVNSDESMRKIKGEKRPLVKEGERAELLAALGFVDYVVIFDEVDPYDIISYLIPDILVKGADWELDKIIGRDVVEENGGRVERIALTRGASTSNIIELILERYKEDSDR